MKQDSLTLITTAVQHSKTLSLQGLLERIFILWFNGLVYNQIWEDPRVDLEALQLTPDSRVMTIASGGCNVLNYLVTVPTSITAIDLNVYQIYLTRLKIVALEHLPSYEEFFRFFGCADDELNLVNYDKYIREYLDNGTRKFWEGGNWFTKYILKKRRVNYFSKNLYNYSRNGYYLRVFHTLAKAIGCDPARILRASSRAEQEVIFNEMIAPFFDSTIVRAIGRFPITLFGQGIPPQQYRKMREEYAGEIITMYKERIRRLACAFPIDDNYFAWQAFSRRYDHFARLAVPDYLKEENYQLLKENIGRVNTQATSVINYLKIQPKESLDRFVLLDAQDWMEADQIKELWAEIARVGKQDSRIIFRTAARRSPVEASLPLSLYTRFTYEHELSLCMYKQDRSAIYGGFHAYSLTN